MRLIPLTREQFACVDDRDFIWLMRHKWCATDRPHGFYALRTIKGDPVYMHRVVMNARAGQIVDHINGDTLDNRRSNLRICTQSQNLMNRKGAMRKSKTGIRGVLLSRTPNRWTAQIGIDGKTIQLGTFKTIESAAAAYAAANKKYFGKYGGSL